MKIGRKASHGKSEHHLNTVQESNSGAADVSSRPASPRDSSGDGGGPTKGSAADATPGGAVSHGQGAQAEKSGA